MPQIITHDQLAAATTASAKGSLRTLDKLQGMLKLSERDIYSGRYRILLYRFLTDSIPVVSSCVWTWAGLSAAPGRFRIFESPNQTVERRAENRLSQLMNNLYRTDLGSPSGESSFLADLFSSLYRDGTFAGFLTVKKDASGVDRFIPIDSSGISEEYQGNRRLFVYETGDRSFNLDRPDFYLIPLGGETNSPLGRSILKSVPFVAYIEQQLVDDMRRTNHNSGYHRLHVKITPPERISGESDQAYIDRINSYFDATVSMIRTCDVDENPVTWDNVSIDYIGPENVRTVTNSWFLHHRAMVEEICTGTNLAPFLLGYSYGATSSWSGFKFDLVMRQIRTVQAEVAHFLEWIASIDLALAGINVKCAYEFDNTFPYQAGDRASVESSRVDNIIKIYQAGLIDKETAAEQVGRIL